MGAARCGPVIFLAIVAAILLRAPELDRRPMHTDEAVHAYKFGQFLDDGIYLYDREEYHGPTLNYLSWFPARFAGAKSYEEVTEKILRSVPVFFGVLLIVLIPLVGDGLGWRTAGWAAVLIAVSPAMVFYSRYYIQEVLLVCFTFGAMAMGYRYGRHPRLGWALGCGAFLGLMFSTKETSVLVYVAMVGGIGALVAMAMPGGEWREFRKSLRPGHLVAAAGLAVVLAAILFTSFFKHPRGILDSILTFETYLHRGAGEDAARVHIHPWYYYLDILFWHRPGSGPLYTEAMILILAGVGFWAAWDTRCRVGGNRQFLRFLAVFTFLLTLLYSVIPYKTPWCLLGFLHGMILLAAVGIDFLLSFARRRWRLVVWGLVVLGTAHLAREAYLFNYRFYADPRNPHVYAHTSTDIFDMDRRVRAMLAASEDPERTPIQVICPNGDYWPFPWYFRDLRAGYYTSVPMEGATAPIILIQPVMEGDLMTRLYEVPPPGHRELYMYLFYRNGMVIPMQLRPGVEIRGFVVKSLWDRFQALQSASQTPSPPTNSQP